MTIDERIHRERTMLTILREWLMVEEKPIRRETFRLWIIIVKRRLRTLLEATRDE